MVCLSTFADEMSNTMRLLILVCVGIVLLLDLVSSKSEPGGPLSTPAPVHGVLSVGPRPQNARTASRSSTRGSSNRGIPQMYGGVMPMSGIASNPSVLYGRYQKPYQRILPGYPPEIMSYPGYGYTPGRLYPGYVSQMQNLPKIFDTEYDEPEFYDDIEDRATYRSGATMYGSGVKKHSKVGNVPEHSEMASSAVGSDDICKECNAENFACVSSCVCIPELWRCDGEVDCQNAEDELECGETEDVKEECDILNGMIRCPRTGKCIKEDWVCDGDDDCEDFSDETNCGNKLNCTSDEFHCANGLCISKLWYCDGDNDCKDYSDEMDCPKNKSCSENEFQCADGNCITLTWRCDSEPDCLDKSDEANCGLGLPMCNMDEFKCAYPRCIHIGYRCDGDDDCGDWSDEKDCPRLPGNCLPGQFRCNNTKCISERFRCDSEKDCDSGEDEEGCVKEIPRTCMSDQFTCDGGNCIMKTWLCDGFHDCAGGEDEKDCEPVCKYGEFMCTKSVNKTNSNKVHCINQKHVCDNRKDCPGGEDELNCPRKEECQAGSKCEHLCVSYQNGSLGCGCYPGFMISANGYGCEDIDECKYELDPVCSQTCNNTIGSFTCGCMTGYTLRPDGRSCKAQGAAPTLLFANRVDIRQLSLNNAEYTALLKGLSNAIALDYHYKKRLIYWTDISMDVIKRASLKGTGTVDVINTGLEIPSGIAVDWIHDLIFWTDSGTRRIEVANLDGKHRTILASSDLDKPRAIVVHPEEAYVFWTDWGPNPKIERIEMDGSNRKPIIKESILWPNGLCIDYSIKKLFWADAKRHVIESCDFDGDDRKKILTKGLLHPFALTVFEDALYWTDWHFKSIITAKKLTGTGLKKLHSGFHFPMDVHSFHSQRQPLYLNKCGKKNGGCSHLCLPKRKGYTCVCPMGLKLQSNKRDCVQTTEKLLVFARKKDLRIRPLAKGTSSEADMVIPVDGVRSAVALDWDSTSGYIFWTDVERDTISRAFINGSNQEAIVKTNLDSPTGLAVDWVTSKLYWTDAGTSHIEVSNLDGSLRALLIWDGLDRPRDIALHPVGGYMYWSDWGVYPKIERAGMDGSQRKILVSNNITWPNGLAIDHTRDILYWTDGGMKTIEYIKLDGSGRTTLIGSDIPHPFGLTIFEDKIYWTDWNTSSIHMADKMSGDNRQVVRSGVPGIMDVRIFHRSRRQMFTMCATNNGGCSHLCLLAPGSYSCACPIGIKLQDDKKTCEDGPINSLIFAHRVDIRQISLDVSYTVDMVLPLPPLKNAVAVDVDRKTGDIYWSDTSEDAIQKATRDGKHVENVVVDGLETADGIVIDSTGRKIYWTDSGRNSVEVAELDGSNRLVLIWSGLESPRAITLHYHHGFMFWSDWGTNGRIERADMDGENRQILISENLVWPNGLAIDRPAGRIYWNDAKRKVIESSNLDGNDRRLVLHGAQHPYGLVIVGMHIYWTDWLTRALHRVDKINGSDQAIIRRNLEGLMDIRSVQVDNVAENACGNNNGGCSHLCLRNPSGYSCKCPTGTVVLNDEVNCRIPPSKFLLFATRRTISRISLDTRELWDVTLPIPGVHNAIAVDFHWKRQEIYHTDVHLDVIRCVNMKNYSNATTILSENITTPDGLAVDWIADNLYWTDAGRKVIEIARLNGSSRKVILDTQIDEPRSLAVYPGKAYLYWTDWGGAPRIERSFLDGSSRSVIVTQDLGFPNGIAIDFDNSRLYWSDAYRDRIETSDLDGNNRVRIVPEGTHPFGLTIHGDYIYWTDWYRKSVERADKTTGKGRITIRSELDGVMEIKTVASERQPGRNPCFIDNGGCSHLCAFRQTDYLCMCPDIPDERPCAQGRPTPVITFGPPSTQLYPMEEFEAPIIPMIPYPKDDMPSFSDDGYGYDNTLSKSGKDMDNIEESASHESIYIFTVSLIVSLLVLGIGTIAYYYFSRRRQHQEKYEYGGGGNVITFANPNYNASNSDVGSTSNTDKKPFLWKKFKYDKSQQDQVYVDGKGRPESLSLSLITMKNSISNGDGPTPEHVVTPLPTPPQRLDSVNLQAG